MGGRVGGQALDVEQDSVQLDGRRRGSQQPVQDGRDGRVKRGQPEPGGPVGRDAAAVGAAAPPAHQVRAGEGFGAVGVVPAGGQGRVGGVQPAQELGVDGAAQVAGQAGRGLGPDGHHQREQFVHAPPAIRSRIRLLIVS